MTLLKVMVRRKLEAAAQQEEKSAEEPKPPSDLRSPEAAPAARRGGGTSPAPRQAPLQQLRGTRVLPAEQGTDSRGMPSNLLTNGGEERNNHSALRGWCISSHLIKTRCYRGRKEMVNRQILQEKFMLEFVLFSVNLQSL